MATIDVSAVQTFTAAQLLTLCENAIAHLLAGGQSYSINGRSFMRADLDRLKQMRSDLAAEVAEAASTTGTMTALASLGKQV